MKKVYLIFIFMTSVMIYPQAPAIDWQKTIGGDDYDELFKISQTTDGGYIISGFSYSYASGDKTETCFGVSDYWILKIDSLGEIEWQKIFGGSEIDGFNTILQTSDGGYVICGNSASDISGNKTENSKGFDDYWVIKLDSLGNILWQKTIGGSANDDTPSIIITPDMGYLIGGFSYSNISGDKTEQDIGYNPPASGTPDYWLVKIDGAGNIQWDNTIGSTKFDSATTVLNASDGGYIVGGYSNGTISGDKTQNSKGGYDIWILKLDTSGTILWQKTIGGSADDLLATMINTADGGYLLGATSKSPASGDKTENSEGGKDYWIVKIDVLGNIIWDKTLGGASDEVLYSLIEDNDQNYYIGGISKSNISGDKTENSKGGNDYWVVKTNSTGTPIWDKTIGGSSNEFDGYINLNQDNSLIIGGTSNSSISGDKTEDTRGNYDYWIVKLASNNLTSTQSTINNTTIYPNPTTGVVNINFGKMQENVKLTLENVLGQVISSKKVSQIQNMTFNIIDESCGVYFMVIENKNGEKKTIKIVKQ